MDDKYTRGMRDRFWVKLRRIQYIIALILIAPIILFCVVIIYQILYATFFAIRGAADFGENLVRQLFYSNYAQTIDFVKTCINSVLWITLLLVFLCIYRRPIRHFLQNLRSITTPWISLIRNNIDEINASVKSNREPASPLQDLEREKDEILHQAPVDGDAGKSVVPNQCKKPPVSPGGEKTKESPADVPDNSSTIPTASRDKILKMLSTADIRADLTLDRQYRNGFLLKNSLSMLDFAEKEALDSPETSVLRAFNELRRSLGCLAIALGIKGDILDWENSAYLEKLGLDPIALKKAYFSYKKISDHALKEPIDTRTAIKYISKIKTTIRQLLNPPLHNEGSFLPSTVAEILDEKREEPESSLTTVKLESLALKKASDDLRIDITRYMKIELGGGEFARLDGVAITEQSYMVFETVYIHHPHKAPWLSQLFNKKMELFSRVKNHVTTAEFIGMLLLVIDEEAINLKEAYRILDSAGDKYGIRAFIHVYTIDELQKYSQQ